MSDVYGPFLWECDLCGKHVYPRELTRLTLDATRPKGSILACPDCYNKLVESAPQIEEIAVDAR